jgi:ComF family protein
MNIFPYFTQISERFFDFLFPKTCVQCAKEGTLLCESCRTGFRSFAPSCFVCNSRDIEAKICNSCKKHVEFSRFYAPFSYKHAGVRQAIHRLKYKRVRPYARILASLLSSAVRRYPIVIPPKTVIVPLPLHPSRKISRGFNQSESIANACSEHLKIPLVVESLQRIKNTEPQISMKNPDERRKNMEHAFRVLDATPIFRRNVLLIDDVATTGETLNAAAKALKDAGASSVWAFTIAR